MILEPKKIKSDTVSTVSPSISHEVMGPDVQMDTHLKIEGKNDIRRLSVGNQGP